MPDYYAEANSTTDRNSFAVASDVAAKAAEDKRAALLVTKLTTDIAAYFHGPSGDVTKDAAKIKADTQALASENDNVRSLVEYDLNKQNSSKLAQQGLIPTVTLTEQRDVKGNAETVALRGVDHSRNRPANRADSITESQSVYRPVKQLVPESKTYEPKANTKK